MSVTLDYLPRLLTLKSRTTSTLSQKRPLMRPLQRCKQISVLVLKALSWLTFTALIRAMRACDKSHSDPLQQIHQ